MAGRELLVLTEFDCIQTLCGVPIAFNSLLLMIFVEAKLWIVIVTTAGVNFTNIL
jgi:hypothetical protein